MFKNKLPEYVQEQIVQEQMCSRTNTQNMFKNKCVQEQILIEQNMNRTNPSLIEQNMNRTNASFKNMNRTRTRRTSNTARAHPCEFHTGGHTGCHTGGHTATRVTFLHGHPCDHPCGCSFPWDSRVFHALLGFIY